MTAYTDAAAIAAYLGRALTTEQAAAADLAAAAVTTWIDHRTGRSWQAPASVSGEVQPVIADTVYLDNLPAVSVEAVAIRPPGNNPWTVLEVGAWELRDAAHGILYVGLQPTNSQASVDYTWAASGAPADLAMAATAIAAAMLQPALNPDLAGLDTLSLGQGDISIKVAQAGAGAGQEGGPWAAVTVVDSYRVVVVA